MARKNYSINQELVARFAKALSHPARVAMCELLAKKKECYFGEIFEEVPLAKATVSQHLTELKNAGLINGEALPPRVKYTLDEENFAMAKMIFNDFTTKCLDACAEKPEEPETPETEEK